MTRIVIALLFFLNSREVDALSCVEQTLNTHLVASYAMIFEGVLLDLIDPKEIPDIDIGGVPDLYRFQVLNVWRGDTGQREVDVWAGTNFLMTGRPYSKGETYIVYAQQSNGHYTSAPDFCGPDQIFSEQEARTFLDEYKERIQHIQQTNLKVRLHLNTNASGTITLLSPTQRWKDIFHPLQMQDALTFVVFNRWGRKLEPIPQPTNPQSVSLTELAIQQPTEYPFSSLSFSKDGIQYIYPLEEGKRYQVMIIYRPFGSDSTGFSSKRVAFRYDPHQ